MATKNYMINDKWLDLDKQNIVELQSVDGELDSLKVNGSEVVTPSGKITITENGTDIDIAQYATADVNVEGGGGGGDFKVIMQTINVPETVLTGVYDPDDQYYYASAVITTANSDVANGVHYNEDYLYRSFWKINNFVTPNEGAIMVEDHTVCFFVKDGNIVAISDGETAFEVTIPNGTIIEIYRASEEVVDAFLTSEYLCQP